MSEKPVRVCVCVLARACVLVRGMANFATPRPRCQKSAPTLPQGTSHGRDIRNKLFVGNLARKVTEWVARIRGAVPALTHVMAAGSWC